jgi:hypothetical protein
MYTKQYGVERNLFLAPGEGDKVPEPEEGAEPRVGGPPAAPWIPRV